jgi:hypothetical protein
VKATVLGARLPKEQLAATAASVLGASSSGSERELRVHGGMSWIELSWDVRAAIVDSLAAKLDGVRAFVVEVEMPAADAVDEHLQNEVYLLGGRILEVLMRVRSVEEVFADEDVIDDVARRARPPR